MLVLLASCGSHHSSSTSTGPAATGTIVGTVTSSLGGSLAGVSIVVTPNGGTALAAVITSASGAFVAASVPTTPDDGTLTLSSLPANCAAPTPAYTGLTGSDTVTVNITVICSPLVGTLRGTITSSMGGGLQNVGVVVTPHGGSALATALTSASGAYVVGNVPLADGTGSIALTNVPANCSSPASTSYSGLASGDTVTVSVTLTCAANAGAVTGTVTSSMGGTVLAGVQVVVTPTGGSALPAVTTNSSGVYTVGGVPIGSGAGTVTVGNVPGYCTAPSAASYTGLTNGVTVTTNVTVPCATATGSVIGTVTSSLGGALSGVSVVVTPTGANALPAVTTTANGAYTVSHVPVGGGTVTLTGGLPAQCSAPAAAAYGNLAYNKTDTVNVAASCQSMGTLKVQVTEPPTALGAVTVTGPANYVRTITQTTTLTGLVPGAYAVTAAPFETPDAIVGTVWEGTVASSPVQVMANTTAQSTVTYHARAGTGALWVIMPDYNNGGGTWGYFTSAQLAVGGSQTMAFSTPIPSDMFVNGMAVDANGTFWMLDQNVGKFDVFKAANGFSSPTSGDTLLPKYNYQPFGAAFDPGGNLWTLDDDNGLVEIPTANLAAGGNTNTFEVYYQSTPYPNFNTRALAFDASGTLWAISRQPGNDLLQGFTQAQLNQGGYRAPAVTIVLPDTMVRAVAFDGSGNLWVSSFGNQHVFKYTPSQLSAGGSPTPTVIIGVSNPTGMAFDASDNLWVVDASDGQLFEFASSQLTTSGTPTPHTTIPLPATWTSSNAPQLPFYLVFDPHPSNLPLNGSRVVRRRR
ncbi:MAG TPA: hypothetical protein VFA43_12570 [Gemmatimonadaceae bacterium]|nr:hypothetical protein [Gemmatimonadaceae bacterium]